MPREAPPGGARPPDPRPPHGTAQRRGARHLLWEDGGNEREGRPTAPQPTNR